ncbi:MAG: UvrD-helicase domain-containing protein [Myxococcales bacterium]|nr:UvrD-helicase domain-containing protein [Myxococcales bacterium]
MVDMSGLNQEQLEAVLTTNGPLLVLAGAGSGKTRVITFRLAKLINNGVSPKSVLCLTFTNKAATEMKERARALVGKSVRGTTISTFHALGARILRAHPEAVGLRPSFTITDGAEQVGTIRRILRTLRIDDRKFDPKRIMAQLSQAKNAGIDASAFRSMEGVLPHLVEASQEDEEYQLAAIEVYERYELALQSQNVVDFDDLLLLTLRLLHGSDEVRNRLRDRWQYIMVDEYQDTNGAQLELLRQLTGPMKNLCVVGDDDQSIYGWRGADVRNILGFEKHFVGAKKIMLLTNYRSTGHILSVANAIIEHNPGRYEKRLRSAGHDGEPVHISSVEDEEVEAEEVARKILSLTESGVSPGDIAVLFRSNVQARPVELALRASHIPYRMVGGLNLFDRREVKDVIAYLRVLHNPDEDQALRRIVNWPPRGIGDTTIKRVDNWAREEQLGLLEALSRADEVDGLNPRSVAAALGLVSLFDEHRHRLNSQKSSTVVKKLLSAAGVESALLAGADDPAAAERRVENVRALVRQLERYEQRMKKKQKNEAMEVDVEPEEDLDLAPEIENASLEGFLADLALTGIEDARRKDERDDQVVLSTIHAAKGLEWLHVYLIGWEEELLPHRRTLLEHAELAEERRLAYVAVTRAKKYLTITWARRRQRFGQNVERQPSRFLENLPDESVIRLEDKVNPPKTESEEREIARDWLGKIRANLEAKRTTPKS